MSRDCVLILIKPDVQAKGLTGFVWDRFSQSGLNLIGIKTVAVSKALAEAHYQHLRNQPFFKEIVNYLQGSFHGGQPVVALVYTGKNAISICRRIAGATNPEEAQPKSVRGSAGRVTTQGLFENLVHVSSDASEARREIKLWFLPNELAGNIYPTKTDTIKLYKQRVWK